MGSVKPVLYKKPYKDNKYPVAIRITHNRKSSYMFTGQYIDFNQWDEKNLRVRKSHSNSVQLNNLILKKTSEANDKLLELEASEKRISSAIVKSHIRKEYKSSSFFKLADDYIDILEKSGKHTRISAEKPMIKHFKDFVGGDIDFRDITELKLKTYQSYLRSTRSIKERTVVNHLVVIRTIFNLAIRNDLVDRRFYPFGKGKIVIRFPQSVKIGLEETEVKALEELQSSQLTRPERHALNAWLFSFYLAGMRVSDVIRLKWSDFQNGRLFYSMGKNQKAGSLKIPEKAQRILNQYVDQKDSTDFVFPELKKTDLKNSEQVTKAIKNADKKFNKHLSRISEKVDLGKPLKMHIARHTFGNLSGDTIPIQMLQKLYRHTSITTTIAYQSNFLFKDVDEALESVVG